MDPVLTSANNASQVPPRDVPTHTTAAPSLLDRIKTIANKSLEKLDEIYDKAGFAAAFAYFGVLGAVAGTLVALNAPIAAGALLVAGIAFETLLVYRNRTYKNKLVVEQFKPVEQEFTKINQKFDFAKFDEQLDKCTNNEELQATMKRIGVALMEFEGSIQALALKIPNDFSSKYSIFNFKPYFENVKIELQINYHKDQWQDHKEDFKHNLEELSNHLKHRLVLVRTLLKERAAF